MAVLQFLRRLFQPRAATPEELNAMRSRILEAKKRAVEKRLEALERRVDLSADCQLLDREVARLEAKLQRAVRSAAERNRGPQQPMSRDEAEEKIIEIAQRTIPPAKEITHYFVCSGNPSLIKAYHDLFRVGAPAYGGSAASYRADESAMSARQANATAASLLFAGQESMGSEVKEVPNVADVLSKLQGGSANGTIFISYVTVGPKGQKWVHEVYTTLLGEAVKQGILPFRMYSTTSKQAAQFLLDSFSMSSAA
jgi:hypothetical protein